MAPSTVSFLAMVVVAMAVLQTSSANPPPAPPAHSPASCSDTLFRLFDCLDFLQIGARIAGPPANCCASLRDVLSSPAAICLCHAIGRDLNAFAGVNIDPVRLAFLPVVCLAIVPPQLPVMCYVGPVPPISTIDQPGTPAAMSPPPAPAAHNKGSFG